MMMMTLRAANSKLVRLAGTSELQIGDPETHIPLRLPPPCWTRGGT